MLSRVANSIYWMARYVERAEHLARFQEVTLTFILDEPDSTIEQWEPLVRATGDEEYFRKHYPDFSSVNVRQFMTFDKAYHSSIITAISHARENARTVQDAISSEAWEQLNVFYHLIRNRSHTPETPPDAGFFHDVVQNCFLFNGMLDATMTRGPGWHFANLGRLLERADKISRILDVKYFTLLRKVEDVDTTFDDLLWSAVLRSVSAFEMYRKQYHTLTIERVVDFLILEEDFPRAIRYCLLQIKESLIRVAGSIPATQNSALYKTDQLLARLEATTARQIIDSGMHEFIDSIQLALNDVGNALRETHFSLRAFPTQSQQQTQTAGTFSV